MTQQRNLPTRLRLNLDLAKASYDMCFLKTGQICTENVELRNMLLLQYLHDITD